jgi:hypothetical protein
MINVNSLRNIFRLHALHMWKLQMMWICWVIINIDTIKENMETVIDASKEVGLEENTEKTKYMLLSRHQNVG